MKFVLHGLLFGILAGLNETSSGWGSGEGMALVGNSELARLREMPAIDVLQLVGDHTKADRQFKPTKSATTQRVHVNVAGAEWEFLVDGPKFFDTRTRKGGGGAIDLVMYLWQVPFRKAVAMLRDVGA